jgi:uroporphyrin-III C-methyltransferase/precorrin-2 dehydrogenase/sirohydrochlorin ferrochelatase
LAGAALIVGAAEDAEEARRLCAAARCAGVPVNVIDRPDFSTVRFGAIVNRSPLVVGISTDGAAPVFAQWVRSHIEGLLPAGFARWVEAAHAWRRELSGRKLVGGARRRFWDRFAALALGEPGRAPGPLDRDRLLAEARAGNDGAPHALGHVSLVGAGPGDPELLTLAAVRALRAADVILYDALVTPEILDFARREAKRVLVGGTGHRSSCRQDDSNTRMISLARSGQRVVRLTGGDAAIFGRAGDAIAALGRANIPHDVVPGITAAQGRRRASRWPSRSAAARGGCSSSPATPTMASCPRTSGLDALADAAATTAVDMPLATLAVLTRRLLATASRPDWPACAVFNATRLGEHVIDGARATILGWVPATPTAGPWLLLMGRALRPFGRQAPLRQLAMRRATKARVPPRAASRRVKWAPGPRSHPCP